MEAKKFAAISIEKYINWERRAQWETSSKTFLARAEFGLRNFLKAKDILLDMLSTSIDIQGYFPLVFTLPITLLFLAEEDIEFAIKVYTLVRRDRFMSKAQLFHDLVYKYLPEQITSIPVEIVEHSPEYREALWETSGSYCQIGVQIRISKYSPKFKMGTRYSPAIFFKLLVGFLRLVSLLTHPIADPSKPGCVL